MRVSRRQFLRGDLSGRGVPVRPPWTVPEFVARCTRCDACSKACPTGILTRERDGFPEVDFSHGECTFCGDCVAACEPGALKRDGAAWSVQAEIGAACIAFGQVVCRSCGDACEARAIQFRVRAGGVAVPVLDAESCTGCGACVAPCPAGAIAMRHTEAEVTA